jgi:hypothetical protein
LVCSYIARRDALAIFEVDDKTWEASFQVGLYFKEGVVMVCDRVNECRGWVEDSGLIFGWTKISAIHGRPTNRFIFCPWCGKELDWDNWERLKVV